MEEVPGSVSPQPERTEEVRTENTPEGLRELDVEERRLAETIITTRRSAWQAYDAAYDAIVRIAREGRLSPDVRGGLLTDLVTSFSGGRSEGVETEDLAEDSADFLRRYPEVNDLRRQLMVAERTRREAVDSLTAHLGIEHERFLAVLKMYRGERQRESEVPADPTDVEREEVS